MAKKVVLNPPAMHKPTSYSHAVRKGNTLYMAGQVALDPQGSIVGPGDAKAQTEQVMKNMKAVVEAAGGTIDDVMKVTVYTTNVAYRDDILAVRNRHFSSSSLPASTFIVVAGLARPEFLVEIEAVAELG